MIMVSYVLGEPHKDDAVQTACESGILPAGTGRLRYSVTFYLVAMFLVFFDVESVLIFARAVAVCELEWSRSIEIVVFKGILLAVLVYLWRLGPLDWGSMGRLATENHGKEHFCVTEYQHVQPRTLLLEIDPCDCQVRLHRTRAAIQAAEAEPMEI
jgi:NADH-quinone oxidoreductase subunit A